MLDTRARSALHKQISETCDKSCLRKLCFHLGVDYQDLSGDTKGDQIISLILHMDRNGRVPDLVNAHDHIMQENKNPQGTYSQNDGIGGDKVGGDKVGGGIPKWVWMPVGLILFCGALIGIVISIIPSSTPELSTPTSVADITSSPSIIDENLPIEDTIVPPTAVLPTAVPTVQSTARPSVSVDRPILNEAENMNNVWQGIGFEDLQSPATKHYSTIISSGEARRWSFIWCGKTPSYLQNILVPLSFSLLIDGQPISSEKLLEHDQVVNNWNCRYWSTILYNWPSGETVELEAHHQLSERIYDGDKYYEAGTYRQIISVQVP